MAESGLVRLAVVGDVFVSSSTGKFSESRDPDLVGVFDYLRGADLVYGNLEQAVGSDGFAKAKKSLTAEPDVLDELKWAGFDVFSVANNHYFDLGVEQGLGSMEEMRRRGITPVGAGRTLEDAVKVVVVEAAGLRIGFISYFCSPNLARLDVAGVMATDKSPGVPVILGHDVEWDCDGRSGMLPDSEGMQGMRAAIREGREDVDVLIVSLHWHWWWRWWGPEDRQTVYRGMQIMARAAVDAGADSVIGHGPHMLSGVEFYEEAPILYSLGNFIFQLREGGKPLPQFWHSPGMKRDIEGERWESPASQRSMIAVLEFIPNRRKPLRVTAIPLDLRMAIDGNPRTATAAKTEEVSSELQGRSKVLGTTVHKADNGIQLCPHVGYLTSQ